MICTKYLRKSFALAAFLILMTVYLQTASADVGISDISVDVSPNSIDTGGNFNVKISLNNPDDTDDSVDVDIEITVDDLLVHQETRTISLVEGDDYDITINSNDFKIVDDDNADIWNKNLMEYACKDNYVVEVTVSGDVNDESDSDEVDIQAKKSSYELNYNIDPDLSSLDDKFTVTVTDGNDDAVKGAKVKVTWIDDDEGDDDGVWDISDRYTSTGTTDSDGQKSFTKLTKSIESDVGYGLYQIDVWMDEYCKVTDTVNIQNKLTIGDPEPAQPLAGETFKVKITTPSGAAATGLAAQISPGGTTVKVASDGYATFKIDVPGTYTILAGGSGTGYDETLKTVTIGKKSQLIPTITPEDIKVNSQVTITVKSNDNAVDGATVTVTRTGGLEQIIPGKTSSNGIILYTPTVSGEYTVKATKDTYTAGTEIFTVENLIKLELPASAELIRGNRVTITAKDQSGNPIPGATISIEGTTISGLTDTSGKFSFTFQEPGEYHVVVKKTGYTDLRQDLIASGQLSVKLSQKEITLDDSVKITVTNMDGVPTEAIVRISGPGVSETKSISEYTYTPTKAGEYKIDADLENYERGTNTLKVNPRPITMSYYFKENNLFINASSNGKPAANLRIDVGAGEQTFTVTTDEYGMASVAANTTGNYTIQINNQDYAKTEVTAVKETGLAVSGYIIPALIALIMLVLVGIFAVVLLGLLHHKKGGGGSAFRKASNSRLG